VSWLVEENYHLKGKDEFPVHVLVELFARRKAVRRFNAASTPPTTRMNDEAHKTISNDDLRDTQPKIRAMANIGVKTAADTETQVATRRVRDSDGSSGISTIAGTRLASRALRSGKKPSASCLSICNPPVSAPYGSA
jgi:hypothetical protein